MAGCDTRNLPGQGDYKWSKKRVTTWALAGAGIGAFATYGELAIALSGVSLGAAGALYALGAVVFAAVAAGALAMFIGYGVEWFTRLKTHNPEEITFHGWVVCARRNLGNPTVPDFCDGDWTFNLAQRSPTDPAATNEWAVAAPGGLTVDEVRTRVAPGAEFAGRVVDPDNGNMEILHTEIGSAIGDGAALGGAIGAGVGMAAGIAAGIAACVALGIVTFGIGLALCALVIAIAAALGTVAGGVAGNLAGAGIGAISDWASDAGEAGDVIDVGCFVAVTGTWVTDRSHQHNEVHDIKSAQVIECGTAAAGSALETAGVVGIGRHPTGPDP